MQDQIDKSLFLTTPHENIICDNGDPLWINIKIKEATNEKNKDIRNALTYSSPTSFSGRNFEKIFFLTFS